MRMQLLRGGQHRLDGSINGGQVIRMHAQGPFRYLVANLVFIEPEHAFPTGREKRCALGHVPVPKAQVAAVNRKVPALFSNLQRELILLHLGDVTPVACQLDQACLRVATGAGAIFDPAVTAIFVQPTVLQREA